MRCVYHDGTVQSIFTASQIPCALSVHPSRLPNLETTDLSTIAALLLDRHMLYLESCDIQPFQIGFFHLVICKFFLSLQGLKASF
jgi:hypothetical protein